MKVLILSSWYPNIENNVSGIFVKEQAKALIKIGINAVVFFPYDKSLNKNQLIKNYEDGILTYRANTDYLNNSKISRINSVIKSIKLLKRITEENKIDIIHSHVCYSAGFVAAFYKKFYEMPYIITEHMSYIKSYAAKAYNYKLFKYSYFHADKVIFVSEFLCNELIKLGFAFNKEIIGNVVEMPDNNLVSRVRGNNEFNIIFIGLMDITEVKGLQYFIPALSNFIKNHPEYDIKFTLVGDGEKRCTYEELCSELNIREKCNFLGKIPKGNIEALILQNDFLVLPSIKETFGSVLIEAMACGKPVLATKCGGPNEFVNDKVGTLVEPMNIKELENGILYMINNYNNFDFNYIKSYAAENFSYKAIGEKLKSIYLKVLEK